MAEKLAIMGGPKTVTIPFPPYPIIGADEVCAATRVVMSGQLSECARAGVVLQMEEEFARYFGVKHCLSFTAGTAAIAGALFAVGVKPGTEVLTPNQTWISAITAICHAGGTPVFCDTKPSTVHIDPREIRRKAGPHTKAVIVTHIWGIPAEMEPILEVARELRLAVVEDCSHGHGAMYKGKLLGTFGGIGCFSLQASKAIIAGEGGFVITDNKRVYQRAMIPGHHAMRMREELSYADLKPFAEAGGYWKYRISPVEAAIATAQLKRLDHLNAVRQANLDRLQARLRKTVPFISWPRLAAGSKQGWFRAPAFYHYDQRKVAHPLFMRACQAEGAVAVGGYSNWYQMPLFQDLKLYSQLWPAKHVNGVEYKPLPAGALIHDEELRERLITIVIPATEAPMLIDQTAAAIEKVAAHMAALARLQRSGKVRA